MIAGAVVESGSRAVELPVMDRTQQGQVVDRGGATVGVFDQMMGLTR